MSPLCAGGLRFKGTGEELFLAKREKYSSMKTYKVSHIGINFNKWEYNFCWKYEGRLGQSKKFGTIGDIL